MIILKYIVLKYPRPFGQIAVLRPQQIHFITGIGTHDF